MAEVYWSGKRNFDISATWVDGSVKVRTKGLRRVIAHHPYESVVMAELLTPEQAEAMCVELRAEHADKAVLFEHLSYKKEIEHKNPGHWREDDEPDQPNEAEIKWEADAREREVEKRAKALVAEKLAKLMEE